MKGLERLHFFDGQRLVARDLELEQKYHIRVRRMLNRGLYSAGVVNGLVVSQLDLRHVKVTTGLALDPRGREVALLSDAILSVPGHLPTPPVQGFFLVIQYNEETEPGTFSDCREGNGTTPPARIKEFPTLYWTEEWPNQAECGDKGHPSACAVVLGMVILDSSCQIQKIDPAVRQYAHSTIPGQVHPFALEGEKDIDKDNAKVIRFQIRGGPPDAALLYLWGDAISSLLYTELGSHSHGIGGVSTGKTASDLGNHNHAINDAQTDSDGSHDHQIRITGVNGTAIGAAGLVDPIAASMFASFLGDPNQNDSILTGPSNPPFFGSSGHIARGPISGSNVGNTSYDYIQVDGLHTHKVTGVTTKGPNPNAATAHDHTLSGSVALAGNTVPSPPGTPYQARDGQPALSYPDTVLVKYDNKVDITGLITSKLGWTSLGDGTGTHALVKSGTGSVDLVQLGMDLSPGQHSIEFHVASGGGKVLYNLYVE